MDIQELLITAWRATIIYFFLLAIVRLLGKREVGASGAFDLVVALMLGEVVDEAIYGDVSMTKGILAIAVIALWHFANAWLSYRSKTIEKLTSDEPTVLVEDGKIKEDALAKERISEKELLSQIRLQGEDKLDEIKAATLEPSGHISVVKHEWARPVQKSDLPKSAAGN